MKDLACLEAPEFSFPIKLPLPRGVTLAPEELIDSAAPEPLPTQDLRETQVKGGSTQRQKAALGMRR